jgi:hypothetical protein
MSYLQRVADALHVGILEDTWTTHADAMETAW